MGKMVEVRLHTLTCEFAGDDNDDLEISGMLVVQGFNDPSAILKHEVIFGFPDGPVQLRQGQSARIDRDVRMAMPTLGDAAGFGVNFLKFGGTLVEKDPKPDTDDPLGEQWQVLANQDVINAQPRVWHLYFGRNEQVVRADFSVHIAHPL